MANPYLTPFPLLNSNYLDNTFPTHHWPLEHTRQLIGHALHGFVDVDEGQNGKSPRSDVRESRKRFYIDVELPGLVAKDQVGLVWINNNTLYLKGTIPRPEILLDDDEKEPKIEKLTTAGEQNKNPNVQEEEPIHFHNKERGIGKFTRIFTFLVDVKHDTMTAVLANGVLRIVLEKMPHEQIAPKDVKIQHYDYEGGA